MVMMTDGGTKEKMKNKFERIIDVRQKEMRVQLHVASQWLGSPRWPDASRIRYVPLGDMDVALKQDNSTQ